MTHFDKLYKLIRQEDVVLFVGAGFSFSANLPSAYKLGEILCEDLQGEVDQDQLDMLRNKDLNKIVDKYIGYKKNSRKELNQILTNTFGIANLSSENHELVSIIPHFNKIISTNYDLLFEQYYGYDKINVVVEDKDCGNIDKGKPTLYKIHGDVNRPDTMVISTSDYTRLSENISDSIVWDHIRTEMSQKTILFIGFSFEDPDVESTINKLSKALGDNCKDKYLLAPNFDQAQINILQNSNITYIDGTAEDFLPTLLDNIKDNIKFDFESKLVTHSTFNKFCRFHNMQITSTDLHTSNSIERIAAVQGKHLQHQGKLNVNLPFNQLKFEHFKDFKELGHLMPGVPAIKVPCDQINDLLYKINGITINKKDDIQSIYILPKVQKEGKVTIVSPSKNKYKDIPYKIYGIGNEITVVIKTSVFEQKIKLDMSAKEITANGEIDLTPTYDNFLEAEEYANFIIELYKGGKFDIYVDNHQKHECDFSSNLNLVAHYEKVLRYYKLIHQIELLSKSNFDIYENYSEQRMNTAMMIYSYYSGEPIPQPVINDNRLLEFHTPERIPTKGKDDLFLILLPTRLEKNLVLNKNEFNINFALRLIPKCKVTQSDRKDSTGKLCIEVISEYTYLAYSDTEGGENTKFKKCLTGDFPTSLFIPD